MPLIGHVWAIQEKKQQDYQLLGETGRTLSILSSTLRVVKSDQLSMDVFLPFVLYNVPGEKKKEKSEFYHSVFELTEVDKVLDKDVRAEGLNLSPLTSQSRFSYCC